jgi:hypothetical protein
VLHSSSVVENKFIIVQTVYKRRKALPQHPNEHSTEITTVPTLLQDEIISPTVCTQALEEVKPSKWVVSTLQVVVD